MKKGRKRGREQHAVTKTGLKRRKTLNGYRGGGNNWERGEKRKKVQKKRPRSVQKHKPPEGGKWKQVKNQKFTPREKRTKSKGFKNKAEKRVRFSENPGKGSKKGKGSVKKNQNQGMPHKLGYGGARRNNP